MITWSESDMKQCVPGSGYLENASQLSSLTNACFDLRWHLSSLDNRLHRKEIDDIDQLAIFGALFAPLSLGDETSTHKWD